eukprot:3210306-Rhodomonas_salina.1
MRQYTPVSSDDELGYFDLVVKVYFKTPMFPYGGKMSQHLAAMAVGDSVEIKGPVGHFTYMGNGACKIHQTLRKCKKIGFVCGGSGLTPAYQVIKKSLCDKGDATEFHLLYANRTPQDILLREELDEWARDYPNRFKVWYTVTSATVGHEWNYSRGYITEQMLEKYLPGPDQDHIVGMSGPAGMIDAASLNLRKIGYSEQDLVVF